MIFFMTGIYDLAIPCTFWRLKVREKSLVDTVLGLLLRKSSVCMAL
jgi:hypothetical protein